MDKKEFHNTLNVQVEDLGNLVDIQVERAFDLDKLSKLLPDETIKNLKRVVMTGCGDSYSAAGAMIDGFKKLSGIRESVVPDPMEFCRYYTEFDVTLNNTKEETLVVATSVTGGSDRISEILQKGNDLGVNTMLICNKPESKGAKVSKTFYYMETPEGCNAPGLRCYFTLMICILALGAYIGLRKGHIDMARFELLKKQIVDYVHEFMKDYERIDDQMFEQAQRMKDLVKFDIMGDGSDYWSAQFIEEKIIECGGYHAMHTNSEEYVHVSMMTREPELMGFVALVTAGSPSYNRIAASTWGAIVAGRKTVICTDGDEKDFDLDRFDDREDKSKGRGNGKGLWATVDLGEELTAGELVICKMAKAPEYWLAPLMNYIPGSLLTGYHTAINGKNFFNNRYDWRTQEFKM